MPKNLRTVYLPANCYKILNYCRLETLKVLKDNNQRGTMICKITMNQLIFLNKIEVNAGKQTLGGSWGGLLQLPITCLPHLAPTINLTM